MGGRDLEDVLETMGAYMDALKFAGGSFSLMPRPRVKELIDICHRYDVQVSTGGFIEYVLRQSEEAVSRYIQECFELEFRHYRDLLRVDYDSHGRLAAAGGEGAACGDEG